MTIHVQNIRVGGYYIWRSRLNIPRRVKVQSITADGRYCQVTYSCSGTKQHACLASELEVDAVCQQKDAMSISSTSNEPAKSDKP